MGVSLRIGMEQRVRIEHDQDRAREARRILDRVAREADSATPSFVTSSARRLRDHLSAVSADQPDPVEYWATRVGRTLGMVITAVLLLGFLLFVARGG